MGGMLRTFIECADSLCKRMKKGCEIMKTRNIRLLSLPLILIMIVSLFSCSAKNATTSDAESGSAKASESDLSSPDPEFNDNPVLQSHDLSAPEPEDSPAETKQTEYADFVMPKETDELTVYTTAMLGVTLSPAVEIFEKMYPGIRVTVKTLGEDEYEALIRTEIPAGQGPDLLFSYGTDLPDIYKTVKTRLFTDLNPYFLNDPSFSRDNYVEGVLDCGLFEGRRYFVPVEYMCPVLVTTEEALHDAGFTADDLLTWDSFTDTLLRYKERSPGGDMFLTPGGVQNKSDLLDLFLYTNFDAIDYINETASVDKDKLEKIANAAKLYYQDKRALYLQTMISGALAERKGLYCNELNAATDIYMKIRGLRSYGETPVFFAMPDRYNGVTAQVCSFAAVPEGAKNKRNAYRLLTVLLSEELQGGESTTGSNLRIGLPVNKNALRGKVYGTNQQYPDVDGEIVTEKDADALYSILVSPSRATIIPPIIKEYLQREISPYIRGEKSWDDCCKRFQSTLELYVSE